MTREIENLVNGLDLSNEELIEISELVHNKAFQKLVKEILRVKKDYIIEECGLQEELNRARLTLEGNKEIIDAITMIDAKYRQEIKNEQEN
jgi:hypothetical protein